MSTENTQQDVTPSDVSAESVSSEKSQQTLESSPSSSFENLKKMAKDAQSTYQPKAIEDSSAGKVTEAVPPQYTPNFKYKAALQEKEVDEFWRPLIKDQDSEKKVIDALQKLDGFDFVKESREKIQKQFESLQNDYIAQSEVVSRVESALERKDLTSVFRQLGVTDQDIFQWTHQKLQMLELPPEQRKAFEDAENVRQQNFEMEEKMSQFQKMYEQQAVQARTMQLDMILSRPEVSQASAGWDNLMGQVGAFRDLVIQEAQTAYYQTGEDLSAEQAVQRVMQKFGKAMQSQALSQAAPQVQSATTPQIQAPQAKPIIPNVTGKGTAPIKKVPKSIEDLKRMAKELEASS